MSLSKSFDPEHADFPETGNRIGVFDGNVPVHLPDPDRAFRPLLITGAGAIMERWCVSQMLQDAQRQDGVTVCLDPGSRYADAFVQRLGKSDAKRILWVDLDAPFGTGPGHIDRVIPLNPCDPFERNDPAGFAAFRRFLLKRLAPLNPDTAGALGFALDAFHRSRAREADRAFTMAAVVLFLQDRDYRRYILSGLHPALLGLSPSVDAFESAAREVDAKLQPIFNEPVWRATLGVATAPRLAKLPAAPIIIVTGAALTEDGSLADLWRFSFFSHLATITSQQDAGVWIYGFGAATLDSPALDPLLTCKAGHHTLLTLARDAYGDNDHQPRLFFDQEIAFEPDIRRLMGHIHARSGDDVLFVQPEERGGSFTLTLPPEPDGLRLRSQFPRIARKLSIMRYGRKLVFVMAEIDALVTACDRGDSFYDTFNIPAPTGWRAMYAKTVRALPVGHKRSASIVDNPFHRKTA